jgi:hypothetical protein
MKIDKPQSVNKMLKMNREPQFIHKKKGRQTQSHASFYFRNHRIGSDLLARSTKIYNCPTCSMIDASSILVSSVSSPSI